MTDMREGRHRTMASAPTWQQVAQYYELDVPGASPTPLASLREKKGREAKHSSPQLPRERKRITATQLEAE
jgi:hypothetical protein